VRVCSSPLDWSFMSWISRIFRSTVGDAKDPILKECLSIQQSYGLVLDANERNYVLLNRNKLTESPLRGLYVQKDIFHVVCLLTLFDSLCEAGVDHLAARRSVRAMDTLEKASKLLPWPPVLYALMIAHETLGRMEPAAKLRETIEGGFDVRRKLLADIVPPSVPERENFIATTAQRLDTSSSLLLGFSDIHELRRKIVE